MSSRFSGCSFAVRPASEGCPSQATHLLPCRQSRCAGFSRGLTLLCALVLLCSTAVAQEKPPVDVAESRRVYVPLDDLDLIIDAHKKGVMLPRDEAAKLEQEAAKNAAANPKAPKPIVLAGADYAATLDGEQLRIAATLEISQLAPDWQALPLPWKGLAVEAATLDDQPAALTLAPDGSLVLYSNALGKHTLKLQLSARLASVGSDRVTAIGFPVAAAALLKVSIPTGKFLAVDEILVQRPTAADQPADYQMAVGGLSGVSLRITDKPGERAGKSLIFSNTAVGIHVAPEELTWRAIASLQVFGQPIDRLEFVIPKSLEIVSVDSVGLERWEIAAGPTDASTTLKLSYRQPFQDSRAVTFAGVAATVIGQPWAVPTLTLANSTSQTSHILVQHPASLRLQQVEATGVRQIGRDELQGDMPGMDTAVAANQMLHFAAWKPDYSLLFITRTKDRELQASIATRLDVQQHELELMSSIAVQSRFGPLFDMTLTLPAEWVLTNASLNGAPVPWKIVPFEAGTQRVQIALPQPAAAGTLTTLTITARQAPTENWPPEADKTYQVMLPEIRLEGVGVLEGTYQIAGDADLEMTLEDITGLDPVGVPTVQLQSARPPRLAYEYQDTRFSGKLSVTRLPARLAATTVAFHRLERETLVSHLEARIVAQGGGVRTLQVALSESAGENLRFELVSGQARIVEQTPQPPANGERLWTLQLDRRAAGFFVVVVDSETPRPAKDQANGLVVLPVLRVPAAERYDGYLAIEGQVDQLLNITATDATGATLANFDPPDLPAPMKYVPTQRIIAAYRIAQPNYKATLTDSRFDRVAVPTAVCDRCDLTTVLGATGELQHRALFSLRAVGVQGLRVKLPEDATLWSAVLDGQPIEVRRQTPGVYEIPLPGPGDVNTVRQLELFSQNTTTNLDESSGAITLSKLKLLPPLLAVVNGEGTEQPLEVLNRTWTLHSPWTTTLTASRGRFEPDTPLNRPSILGRLQSSFLNVSRVDLGTKVIAASAAVIGLWVLSLLIGRLGLKAAMAIVLGTAFSLFIVGACGGMLFLNEGRFADKYTLARTPMAASAPATESAYSRGAVKAPYTSTTNSPPSWALPAPGSEKEVMLGIPESAAGEASKAEDAAEKAAESPPEESKPAPLPPPAEMPAAESDADAVPLAKLSDSAQTEAELGRLVQRFRELFDQKRFHEAEMIAKKAREVAPENPLSKAMWLEVVQAKQNQLSEDAKRKADYFTTALNGVEDKPANGDPFNDPAVNLGNLPNRAIAGEAGVERFAKGIKADLSGRLSLALALEIPPSRTTTFHYAGEATAPELVVLYQRWESMSALSCAIAVGMAFLFWLMRKRSSAFRALLAVVGIVGPFAASPVASLSVMPYLDGIFMGALVGVVMWLICAVSHWIYAELTAPPKPRKLVPPAASTAAATPVTTALVVFALSLWCATAVAQPQPAEPPPPVNPTPTVIVPYAEGEDPLKSDRVLLPYEKFVELWNAAHPDQRKAAPAPIEGAVAEALYTAKIIPAEGMKPAQAEIQARFAVHQLRDQQTTLPLPLAPIPLLSAQLDGQSAPLVSVITPFGPSLAIVLSKPGLHVVDLKFQLPVEAAGPAGKFRLSLRPTAAGTLKFTLPAKDLLFKVTGTGDAFRQAPENDTAVAVLPITAAGDLVMSWVPAQARDKVDAIVHVESATAVVLDDSGLRLNLAFNYTVRQGTLTEATFTLPAGVQIKQIRGLDIGGWSLPDMGDVRTVTVSFRRPITDKTHLLFELFQPLAITEETLPVAVPAFAPVGVTRETGLVAVYTERQFSLATGAAQGLSQIDNAGFSPVIEIPRPNTPPQFAWRFVTRPWQLPLLVSRQKPASRGTAEHAALVTTRKIRMKTRLDLILASAPRSEIVVQLPVGYLLNEVLSADINDYYVQSPGADQPSVLHVELTAPRTGRVELLLDGALARDPAVETATLAWPVPLEMTDLRSTAAVWLDAVFTASLQDFTSWKSVDPQALPQRLVAVRPEAVQFAFSSTSATTQPVSLGLTRALAGLSADSLVTVVAHETELEYLLALQWKINRAGETRFAFTTPDSLVGKLDINRGSGTSRIRQIQTEKLEGGRARWTLLVEEPQREKFFVTAKAMLPAPVGADARIRVPAISFEQQNPTTAEVAALATQRHYAVLVNHSRNQLDLIGPTAVDPIAAAELPMKIPDELVNQAAAILKIKDAAPANPAAPVPAGGAAEIGWKVQPVKQLQSLPAAVNLIEQTLVLSRDGTWRTSSLYRVKNRSRQYLGLKLPTGTIVLSLYVQNQPQRPVRTQIGEQEAVLIPLPKTAEGDLSSVIQLVCAGDLGAPLPKSARALFSPLDLPSPQVLTQEESPDYGAPVARTEWTVYLPADIEAVLWTERERSNMTYSVAGFDRTMAEVSEYLDLQNQLQSGILNDAQRMRCVSNLKQLDLRINAYDDFIRNSQLTVQQRGELEQRVVKVRKGQQLNAAQQPVPAQQDAREGVINYTDGTVTFDDVQQFEKSLNEFNRPADDAPVRAQSEELNLGLEVREQTKDSEAKQQAMPQTPSKSNSRKMLRGQSAGQSDLLSRDADSQQVQTRVEGLAPAQRRLGGGGFGGGDGFVPPQGQVPGGQPTNRNNTFFGGGTRADPGVGGAVGGPGGGMGGLGGGQEAAGGAQMFDQDGEFVEPNSGADFGRPWSAVGGLSLRMEIPTDGQRLTFSKAGGDAKQALGLRPRDSRQFAFGALWAALSIAFGVAVVTAFSSHRTGATLRRRAPAILSGAGLVWFFTLPFGWLGFAVFLAGGLGMSWMHAQSK